MIFASSNEGKIKKVKKILNMDIKSLNDLDEKISKIVKGQKDIIYKQERN